MLYNTIEHDKNKVLDYCYLVRDRQGIGMYKL